MALIIRNITGSPVEINDLGITIPANGDIDLTFEAPSNVATSEDLVNAINGGSLRILDPVGGSPAPVLSAVLSVEAVQAHNDAHFGIRYGFLNQLEDIDLSGLGEGDVLRYVGSPPTFVAVDPATLSNANFFETWQGAGNVTGSSPAAFSADEASDTVTLVGGDGINLNFDTVTDTITFTFGNFGLVDTAVELSDTVVFFDSSNNDEPETRSFQNVFNDLDVPYSITADGFLVRTADDTYASRTLTVAGTGLLDGLTVTNGDGIAGDPEFGLDIVNTPTSDGEMVESDLFVGADVTGSPQANVSFSGQQIADGVLSIHGLAITTVPGVGSPATQQVLTLVDPTRSNKILSVETTTLTWSDSKLKDADWVNIGDNADALSGYIVPLNATIVKIMAHTADDKGNAQTIQLYVDGVDVGAIATFTGAGAESSVVNETANIDVTAGQKLRLRAGNGGDVEDAVIVLWLKWRG